MNKSEKKYSSFIEFCKDQEKYPNIMDLNLSGSQGFQLRDINDIEQRKNHFPQLKSLNISDNLISKLVLRGFISIQILNASKNMISEVILNLNQLRDLDLSYNFLSKVIDLTNCPSLQRLDLKGNLIESINIIDLIPIKKSANNINLAFNKIKFEANEYIAFIEGLKVFSLNRLSLEGNDFITENKALTHSYKIFAVATILTLTHFNEEAVSLTKENLNPEEITKQILKEEKDLQINKIKQDEKTKNLEEETRKTAQSKRKSKLISTKESKDKLDTKSSYFMKDTQMKDTPSTKDYASTLLNDINNKLEELNLKGGNDQHLLLNLLNSINGLLTQEEIIVNHDNEIVQENYAIFLMNCLCLIELNSSVEKTIFQIIAEFSLYNKGVFCKKSFDFFESLVKSSAYKSETIISILESVVVKQLESIKEGLPFEILKTIIGFFDNTDTSFDYLYINLIPNVVNHLLYLDIQRCISEKDKENECIICMEFIIKYLNILEPLKHPSKEILEYDENTNEQDLSNRQNNSYSSESILNNDDFDENSLSQSSLISIEDIEREYGYNILEMEDNFSENVIGKKIKKNENDMKYIQGGIILLNL